MQEIPPVSSIEGLRIALVGEYGLRGGARTYFEGLVIHLIRQGCRLLVLHPDELPPRLPPETSNDVLRLKPVPLSTKRNWLSFLPSVFKRNPVSYGFEAYRIGKKISEESQEIDLVIHSVASPGRFLPWGTKTIPIIQIHHTYPRGVLHKLAGPVFGSLVSRDISLVGVSDFVSDALNSEWSLTKYRAQTLPNTAGDSVLQSRSEIRSPSLVLCVGVANDAKAPFRFIEVARLATRLLGKDFFRFRWVGDGPLLEKARRRVVELGLTESIAFVGHSSSTDREYREADFYLQLSDVDSMPLATLDALRFGIPPLVSRVGGLPRIVSDAPMNLVFSPDEISEVVSTLRYLQSRPGDYAKVSKWALEAYRSNFSPTRWAKSLESIILQCLTPAYPDNRQIH